MSTAATAQAFVMDVDSHEMVPGPLMGELWGEPGRMLGELLEIAAQRFPDPSPMNLHRPDVAGDAAPIDPSTVWQVKGPVAPSAIELDRRGDVLDAMGIARQLVFPSSAIAAMLVGRMADIAFERRFGGDASMFGGMTRPEFAAKFLEAYNDWVVERPDYCDSRVRLVGLVPTSPDLDEMIETATRLVERGVRAVYLQADAPPGGLSPAHSALDALWEMFESENVAVTFHVGTEVAFLDPRWSLAETFSTLFQSAELPNANLQTFSMIHVAVDNYLSTMVLGGVLERFPRLRIGVLEVGAHWVGNAAERMDMYVNVFSRSEAAKYSMKPAEFIARNVRVSPFNFEPVDEYFAAHPQLSDVYCYSSDYPHLEGMSDSMRTMHERVEPLGPAIVDKFFRTNGEWLLP